jgi:hypothetical protein
MKSMNVGPKKWGGCVWFGTFIIWMKLGVVGQKWIMSEIFF